MEEEDNTMYSSPYDNYLRIVETIRTLESGDRLTEDWFEEHKGHILKYREQFINFAKINEDVEESEFRTKAVEVETILCSLVHEIRFRRTFNTKVYLILNRHLKELTESLWEVEELSSSIGGMGM